MGYIDVHSHILPGVDDGSGDMEQSLEMLYIAEREGIMAILATPHYKSGRFRADGKNVMALADDLQWAAQDAGLHSKIYVGTEIYYHSELEGKLQNGSLLTMNGSAYVLIEFSPFEEYAYIRNAVEDVLGMGYLPVLAHVERYQCLLKDIKRVWELKEMGCNMQVNAASITGQNGLRVKKFVGKLLERQLLDYVGTDAHGTVKRRPEMKKCAHILYKRCARNYADALLFRNAERHFINGESKDT